MVYEFIEDFLFVMWYYNEIELEIVRGWYVVGIYFYVDDIAVLKEVFIIIFFLSFLVNNEVRLDIIGLYLQLFKRSFKLVDDVYNLFEVMFKEGYLLVYYFQI